jgi:arginase
MELSLIAVPYHLGRADVGAARGPDRILRAVAGRGLELPEIRVAPSSPFTNEVAASMSVNADLADRARRELAGGRTPVAISADCFSCLGTLAALSVGAASSTPRIGVVWLDAHGDFNTAATSPTGYLDGMAARGCGRAGMGDRRGLDLGLSAG